MPLPFLRKRRYRLPAFILFLLVISVWARTSAFVSFYHTNIGSYQLFRAALSNGELEIPLQAWDSVDLRSASSELRAALRSDHQNNHAYTLLGHAYAAAGQLSEAAHTVQRLHQLKPEDGPGSWRLGLIYQRMAEAIDLGSVQNSSTQSAAGGAVISVQAIRAPSCPSESKSCPYEVALIAIVHPLSVNAAFTPEARFRVLFLPLSAEVRFPLHITPSENAFTFYLSLIDTDVLEEAGNVNVDIVVRQGDQREMPVLTFDLTYSRESNAWLGTTVDLSRWQGADINLLLRATVEAKAHITAQDTRSSESRIMIERLPSLVELWQDLTWDARLLVRRGDQERQGEKQVSAIRWYKQAAILEPEAGYIWERLGMVYEEQKQWHKALLTYQRASDSADYQGIASLARIYTKLAMIPKWYFGDTDPNTMKSYLFSAIRVGDFPTRYDEADTHYKLAEILWDEGAFEGALRHLQLAVQSDPTYIWAHVLRGWALYRTRGDVEGAEQELRLALDLGAAGRQAYWVYRHLGVINWHEGRKAEAIAMFRNALRADPSSGQTLAQLIEEATGESWSE